VSRLSEAYLPETDAALGGTNEEEVGGGGEGESGAGRSGSTMRSPDRECVSH